MGKYLDITGLTYLVKKIRTLIDGKANSNHTHNYAGSSTAGGAAISALTCTGNSATATNADMVDGCHAYQMQTLAANGENHGSTWLMQVRHNVDGDGYFKLFCGDGSVGTKVDMAHASNYSTQATNSDALDGYHGDNYVFSYSNYGSNYFGSNDLNTWVRSGYYATHSSCTNMPPGSDGWGTIFIVKGIEGRVSQYLSHWNDPSGSLWFRNLNGSSWSAWNRFYSSSNITYGTAALTPGTSSLATGSIYLQYE